MARAGLGRGTCPLWTWRSFRAMVAPRSDDEGRHAMKRMIGCLLILVSFAAGPAHAQFGVPWRHTPMIAVVSSAGDPRLGLVDDAVSFWNKTLGEVGSGFRLGSVTRMVQPVPEAALQALSLAVVGNPSPADIPQALRGLPADL